ncbi:hypothetical protein Patl1_21857 [Pistacia atlantica]|uniref:Uncharacterized protein n=1 Tax=Pistacia atlantica TaxID=434234 RepID=A0ACC1BJD8_9ROSI|nr:hypothetical protein Patl1_21857 [Pistacia atlantica]
MQPQNLEQSQLPSWQLFHQRDPIK